MDLVSSLFSIIQTTTLLVYISSTHHIYFQSDPIGIARLGETSPSTLDFSTETVYGFLLQIRFPLVITNAKNLHSLHSLHFLSPTSLQLVFFPPTYLPTYIPNYHSPPVCLFGCLMD